MKKILVTAFFCLGMVTASYADLWDDTPTSSGWDTPATPAPKPATPPPKAQQPQPVADWDDPAPEQQAAPAPQPAPAPEQQATPAPQPAPVPAQQAAPAPQPAPAPEQQVTPAPQPTPAPEQQPTPAPAPEPAPAPIAAVPADSAAQTAAVDSVKTDVPVAAEPDAKQVAAADATKSMKKKKPADSKKSGSKIHWVPLSICAVVAVAGGVMAAMFDSKAKDVTSGTPDPNDPDGYKKAFDDAGTYQDLRAVSIGIAAAGLVGVGVTFMF